MCDRYVTGFSNGGMLSFTLAESLGNQIAGVVPVFGLPVIGYLGVPPAIPYLYLSGRDDRVIPPEGGESLQGCDPLLLNASS